MASRHIIHSSLLRSLTSDLTRSRHILSPVQRRNIRIALPQATLQPHHSQRYRLYSTEGPSTISYSFKEIESLTKSPSPTRVLIDVREPHEFAAGHIPTAHNMPITSQPDGLFLPPDEFVERFGFPKPDTKDVEVVFYCKSGVRSKAAATLALQGGFERVSEYGGSWLDWTKQGGQEQKE